MDFELRRAREKLEKEQRERKERARLKLQREKKAKEEAARQRGALEAVQRARRLDAAEAQLKAEQHEAESMLAGGGVMFSRILEAVPFQGVGDKIKLPPSCFSELSDQGVFDKGPSFFRVSVVNQGDYSYSKEVGQNDDTHRKTHCGVLEFTAEEGYAGLPPHIWSNLFPANSSAVNTFLVEVQYVRLPKGSYAKLQPESSGFLDIPNHKAVLETSLRQCATLSRDDIITVRHGELTYKLQVLELKPGASVSVLETDIEVDIVDPSESGRTNLHALNPLKLGVPESGTIMEGEYMYYKFSVDDCMWDRISSGDVQIEVKLETETSAGDTDLYISRHPLLFPTRHQHLWSSHDVGSKALILGSKDSNLGVGNYSVGLYGYQGVTKYEISVDMQDTSRHKVGRQASAPSALDFVAVDSVECRNCKHYIPSRSIALHEVYCSRHNIVCQHVGCGVVLRTEDARNHVHCDECGKAFQKAEMEKHMKVFHEPFQCSCGVFLDKEEMMKHQSTNCPMRMITCRFCGDIVPAGSDPLDMRDQMRGLSEHESLCGSRTAPCDSCGRAVMLKEMDIHHIAAHPKN